MEIKQHGSLSVTIDDLSGRIISIKGTESFGATNSSLHLFALRFRDEQGNPHVVTSDEMKFSRQPGDLTGVLASLVFDGMDEHGVSAIVQVKTSDLPSELNW